MPDRELDRQGRLGDPGLKAMREPAQPDLTASGPEADILIAGDRDIGKRPPVGRHHAAPAPGSAPGYSERRGETNRTRRYKNRRKKEKRKGEARQGGRGEEPHR